MHRGNKGKDRRRGQNGQDTDISKTLSWVLRHGAVQEGLTIESSGYVPLEQVMQFLKRKGCKNVDEQRIKKVVDNNDKKRFEIQQRKHHRFIRATQGHTMKIINTQHLLTKIIDSQLYPTVIHGTFSKLWGLIKAEGLKRMTRNHIHFAPGMPKEEGVISGMRGSCDIIIQINIKNAMKDGIEFYISSNNVILTEGDNGVLKPKYFLRVMRKDGSVIEDNLDREEGEVKKVKYKEELLEKEEIVRKEEELQVKPQKKREVQEQE